MPGDGSVTPAGSCGSEAELASPGGGVRPPGVRPREPENCEFGVGGGRELMSRVVLLQYFCVGKTQDVNGAAAVLFLRGQSR